MMRCDAPIPVLTYATPDVRPAPPRTLLRMIAAGVSWFIAHLLGCIRLSVLALGYLVFGTGIVLRFIFSMVAIVLLFIGGLKWQTVKSHTLHAANWIDRKTLEMLETARRRLIPGRYRK